MPKISTDDSSTTSTNILNRSQPINSLGFKKEEDEICFIGAQNCCVCFVDIIDSTGLPLILIIQKKLGDTMKFFLTQLLQLPENQGQK